MSPARSRRRAKSPLSVRFDERTWDWLMKECERRKAATGARIGPSSIVREAVERLASRPRPVESIFEFRKRLKLDKYGLEPEFFDQLRDRSPGPESPF